MNKQCSSIIYRYIFYSYNRVHFFSLNDPVKLVITVCHSIQPISMCMYSNYVLYSLNFNACYQTVLNLKNYSFFCSRKPYIHGYNIHIII